MISTGALNRASLQRQLLLERSSLSVTDAIRRLVAVQAQEAPSPYLALWNRLLNFDPNHLDAAFADGTVVKANSVRMTLHATLSDDYQTFRQAIDRTLQTATDRQFLLAGMSADEAESLLSDYLLFAVQPRTGAECEQWVEARVGVEAKAEAWLRLGQYAPLLRAPTGGAWSFTNRTAYIAPRTGLLFADSAMIDSSLQSLTLRYLEGFGPASLPDIAQFALVQRGRVKQALAALADRVVQLEGPSGETLYDLPGATLPAADIPVPPRLLGMWDNLLLAYKDRSRIIPPTYRPYVIRINGDALPTLLVDGYVAGVWRLVDGRVEVTAFHALSEDDWIVIAAEAAALQSFLATREPFIYRRFDHWWRKGLPGEARVL